MITHAQFKLEMRQTWIHFMDPKSPRHVRSVCVVCVEKRANEEVLVKKRKKKIIPRMNYEAEVQRLTAKCRERSNECFLLTTQLAAANAQLDALRRAWKAIDDLIGPGT